MAAADNVFALCHIALTKAVTYKSVPKRYVNELVTHFDADPVSFSRAIQNVALQLIPQFRRDPASERGMKVIVAVLDELKKKVSTFDSENDIKNILRTVVAIMKLMLQGCEAKEKPTRLGCVWMLERLIAMNFCDVLDIPDHIFTKMIENTKVLLKDKYSPVRYFSIHLAAKLNMLEEIEKVMNYDPLQDVRKQAVNLMPMNEKTKICIGGRLCDKEESVRQAACKRLQEVLFSELPLEIRREIVSLSVKDRSEKIRDEARKIISSFFSWFKQEAHKEEAQEYEAIVYFTTLLEINTLEKKYQREVTKCIKLVCETIVSPADLSELLKQVLFPSLCSAINTPGKNTQSSISKTSMLLLRVITEYLKGSHEEILEKVIPDVDLLCQLVLFYQQQPDLFFAQNMILISYCIDRGEEFSRQKLLDTYREVCFKLPLAVPEVNASAQIEDAYNCVGQTDYFYYRAQDVLSLSVSLIKQLQKEYETEFCRIMIEIINEIRDPLIAPIEDENIRVFVEDTQRPPSMLEKREALLGKITELDDEIEALENEKERLIDRGEYSDAIKVKQQYEEVLQQVNKMEEELNHLEHEILLILYRSLMLHSEMLRNSKQGDIDADASEIINTLIYPAFKFTDTYIPCLAIESLGLHCLLKYDRCREYLYIFKTVLDKKEDTLIEFLALRAVLDFFMVFEILKEDEDEMIQDNDEDLSCSGQTVFAIAASYLDSNNSYMQALTCEGLCKLLLLEKIKHGEPVLTKLLLLFFDQDSPDSIKQVLHVFFTHYSLLCEKNAMCLAESFKMVLSVITNQLNKTEIGSFQTLDLSQVNLNRIFSFVFLYLNPDYLREHAKFTPTVNLHFNMFYYLSKETLNNLTFSQAKIYPRMIAQANFYSFTPKESYLAAKLLNKLAKEIKDKTCLNSIQKAIEITIEKDKKFAAVLDPELEEHMEDLYEESINLAASFIQKLHSQDPNKILTPFKSATKKAEESDDPIESSSEDYDMPAKRIISSSDQTPAKKRFKSSK
ncbi:unnamed protein product [Blepharisma stoltei]|uniref:Nuclear condensin complex subunit 3 C-terminal domain-containing protein n=1 Tax=Blepharisma stoltei TaxID=1481888 RepID=A0AAU9IW45_9CILI|nr:unnamed protein product [Blepharisma stoltei]